MKTRKPAYLQITRKCNNRCVFCSNPQFDYQLTLEEIKNVVNDYKKRGVTEITLSGGEPTTYKQLPEIISYLHKNKFDIKIVTNGVNFSDYSYVKKLFDSGLRDVHISVHTYLGEVADKLSRKDGHLKKSLQGISNALRVGMHVSINSTINSLNCKHLSKFIGFMINKFPEIKHYVFNNLDPGNADSITLSEAWKNQWIIARFVDMELELSRTASLLNKKNKSFRIERVPLCYMQGFEQFSSEARRRVKSEEYLCYFLEKGGNNFLMEIKSGEIERRVKSESCKFCRLDCICAGVSEEYAKLHGLGELFPVFQDPESIKNCIISDVK